MYAFNYERPMNIDDAVKLVADGGQALAGGQTMLAAMKQRLMQPEKLVDLSQLKDLQGVCLDGNQLVIGAMTTHQQVETNADVKKHIPALAALAAALAIGRSEPWEPWADRLPITIQQLVTPALFWHWMPPYIPTSAPFPLLIFFKACMPRP